MTEMDVRFRRTESRKPVKFAGNYILPLVAVHETSCVTEDVRAESKLIE